jgi:hypothetical protein
MDFISCKAIGLVQLNKQSTHLSSYIFKRKLLNYPISTDSDRIAINDISFNIAFVILCESNNRIVRYIYHSTGKSSGPIPSFKCHIDKDTQVIIIQPPIFSPHLQLISYDKWKQQSKLALEFVCDRNGVSSVIGFISSIHPSSSTSILISGLPGTGKSSLAMGLADAYNMEIIGLRVCDLYQYGAQYADKKFVEVCNMVVAVQYPCMLLLDDIESIILPATSSGSKKKGSQVVSDSELDQALLLVCIRYL